MMGCTTSSPSPAAPGPTGNGSLKNGSVIEQANGIAGSATANGHGNGSMELDKMKSTMNDMLTDAANLDAQSVKKDLEEVGENLREAVEEGTQQLMDELSKVVQDSEIEESTAATQPTPVPTLSPEGTQDTENPEESTPAALSGLSDPDGAVTEEGSNPEGGDPESSATQQDENLEPPAQPADEVKEGTEEPAQATEGDAPEASEKAATEDGENKPEEAASQDPS